MKRETKQFDVLIIDDNVDLSKNLKEILETYDFSAQAVHSGAEALDICKKYQFTLVLTDINLPDISGLDLIKDLHKISPSMEYIIITGNASLESAIQAIKNREILSYEPKPLNLDRLINFIEQVFERKRTEQDLVESERRLTNLMDNLPGMAYSCLNDQNWTMKFLSSGCKRLTGYETSDFINNQEITYNEIIHPDDRQKVSAKIQQKINNNQPYQIEYRVITKNEDLKWVWEQGRLIESNDEEILEGLIIDVTERKEAEKDLERSQKRYKALFEYSHDAIAILEPPDWKYSSVNPKFMKLFQIENEDQLSKTAPGDLSPETQPDGELSKSKAKRLTRTAMKQGVNFFEWAYKKMDGTEFPATVLLNKVKLEGKFIIQATIRDITQRKQAEMALRRSEKKYHSLIEQSNDAIYLMYNNRFEVINKKFKELFGVTKKDVNKKDFNILDLVAPKSREDIKKRLEMVRAGQEPESRYEFTALDKDNNEIEVEVSVNFISYKDGKALQGILRDITERKEMEEQLRQTQKLESIGNLAAGIAHDFNNILTVIQGNAQMAETEIGEDNIAQTYLDNVINSSQKAASLTEQLLLFSRKQPMDFQTINLNSIIRDVLKMLRRLLGEKIKIETKLAEDLYSIKADRNNLEQVIMNMAINSKDAMPEGGTLSLSTKNIKTRNGELESEKNSESQAIVRMIIKDTGTGIKEQNLDKIFDPFFTTKGLAKGTGMGLSAVYGIVKKHKGQIEVQSEYGQGTTFQIDFPAIQVSQQAKKTPEKPGQQLKGMGEKILFIEDNPDVLKVGRIILEQNGYKVETVKNAAEALQVYKSNRKDYDLIISDVVLPDTNGLEIVDNIKSIDPDIPIILCSGYTDDKSHRKEINEKGYTFIQKPFNIKEMLQNIKNILKSN